MPKELAARRNEVADTKRAVNMHLDLKILIHFVFSPVAVDCLLQEEALKAEPIRKRQKHSWR